MDWATYYERFYGWADSTQVSRISSIDEFGDVGDEVAEIVQNLYDEKAASRLVRRALRYGVRFTSAEIADMVFYLDTVPDELLLSCKTLFTQEQIDSIAFSYHNSELLDIISKKSGLKSNEDLHFDEVNLNIGVAKTKVTHHRQKASPLHLFRALFVGIFRSLFPSENKKFRGKCNGDCANCPAHFGYRFGRWYYGHGHNYGCEFGRNRGGGNA